MRHASGMDGIPVLNSLHNKDLEFPVLETERVSGMDSMPVLSGFSSSAIMIFRIVFAGLCGMAIGYGRQRSNKPSGIKTHMVVA